MIIPGPEAHASLFGINWDDLWRAFLMFLGTYFGSKHGTINGKQ